MTMFIAIAAGGALGAVLRYLLNAQIMAFWGAAFPLGILAVNVFGCFAMGLVAGGVAPHVSAELRAFLTTGVLGGFTTFSAFALDTAVLFDRARADLAAVYVVGSVGLSLLAVFAGLWLARSLAS